MIIEFIGSTGAGKSTLISEVQHKLLEHIPAVTPFELIAKIPFLRRMTNPTFRNLFQDLVGFPFFICSLKRHRIFITFVIKTLTHQSNNIFFTLNYLRSIIRKIGIYELIRRYHQNRVILVDEGTILSAHLLFVYTRNIFSQKDIETFANLVPLPDLVVYVKSSVDILVQRSLQRSDRRKELKWKNQDLIEKYIRCAVNMFDQLTNTKNLHDKTLSVINLPSNENGGSTIAHGIAKFICNTFSGPEKFSSYSAQKELNRYL